MLRYAFRFSELSQGTKLSPWVCILKQTQSVVLAISMLATDPAYACGACSVAEFKEMPLLHQACPLGPALGEFTKNFTV